MEDNNHWKMNMTKIVAFCLLGLILFDVSSIFWDEFYRRRDDEPVKNQIFNFQQSVSSTASGTTSFTSSTTTL